MAQITKLNAGKILSLFSGCGGLDLGFHLEGYKTIWANDFSKFAVDSFNNFFGNIAVHANIEDIDPSSTPDCDLILGGFPCQDFSIIWKQPGLDGARGGLYRYFLNFVRIKKPKCFIAENVKGLLTANKNLAIETIVKDFESISPGYVVKPKLYNFADYGVPQFRERVLIVGIRKDTGFCFKHPKPSHGPNRKNDYVTAGQALKGVEATLYNNEKIRCLEKTRQFLELIPEGGNFSDVPRSHPLYVKGMISHVYRRINLNEPSKTLIAAGGGGTWGYHYPEPRPLTNRERARLQSFPDDFVFSGPISEVRRQIGNAVPPTGVRLLAKTLKSLFNNTYTPSDLDKEFAHLKGLTIKERLIFVKNEFDEKD